MEPQVCAPQTCGSYQVSHYIRAKKHKRQSLVLPLFVHSYAIWPDVTTNYASELNSMNTFFGVIFLRGNVFI